MQYYQVVESWEEMTTEKLTTSLDKVRKVIIKGLDDSFEKPDVFEKYKWLKEQYHKLIILDDFDFKTKSEENIKMKIRNLNEGITGQNVHYSYTDEFYEINRKNKRKK